MSAKQNNPREQHNPVEQNQPTNQNNPAGQNNPTEQHNPTEQNDKQGNAIKDPKDWITGDEPMTEAQRSYLNTLAGEAHENPPGEMTKAEASEKIEELQHKTGRGERR